MTKSLNPIDIRGYIRELVLILSYISSILIDKEVSAKESLRKGKRHMLWKMLL